MDPEIEVRWDLVEALTLKERTITFYMPRHEPIVLEYATATYAMMAFARFVKAFRDKVHFLEQTQRFCEDAMEEMADKYYEGRKK